MNTKRMHIPRHPVLGRDAAISTGLMIQKFRFSSDCPDVDPSPNGASWPGPVMLGQSGTWNPADNGLDLELAVQFMPHAFFGNGAVAAGEAVLGIALEWSAPAALQRGIGIPVPFRRDSGRTTAKLSLSFAPGQVRGNVSLEMKVFVLSPAPHPKQEELHFANVRGLCLGSLSGPCILAFDGDPATFPISEYRGKPGEALWRLHYSSSDPCEDPLHPEFICLEINSAHADYAAYAGTEGSGNSTPLERQVVASWMSSFLLELKDRSPEVYDACRSGRELEYRQGSIAHFAMHLLESFPIRTGSVTETINSVNRAVEEKLLNGTP